MPIQIQLVHAEPGRRVVLASDLEGQVCRAMALGEGSSAEEAEDRARQRLAQVLTAKPQAQAQPRPQPEARPQPKPQAPPQPQAQPQPQAEPQPEPQTQPELPLAAESTASSESPEPSMDPEDWSSELASLEIQLKRLGWNREQESSYLLRAFGHGSRSRLTRYSDLMAYLRGLEALSPGADPASCPMPLKRADLLSQCDALLQQLDWDANRGRQLLESHFQRGSRQQLSDDQLLAFNMLLEEQVMAGQ